jgi:hypothetical protein
MAHKYGDRVRESSTTTGTGTFALNGAATGGYQAFSSVCSNNDTVFYSISDPSGTKWEVGYGTWQTGGNLVRTAGGVLSGSSGAGTLVSFDAGTKDVMLVLPMKSGILGAYGGAIIASAAALPVPTGRVVHVSGTTGITSALATNLEVGTVVTLIFDSTLDVTKGNNLVIEDNFHAIANSSLTLAYDGTNWYEVARSAPQFPMGEISYFSMTGTAVVIAAQSDGSTNMVKVALVTTGNFACGFDNGGADNGRLRYIGAATRDFHIACTWSAVGGVATDRLVFGIAKNGTVIAASKVLQDVSASVVQGNAIHVMAELATNDYLELFVGNTTDTDDPTVYNLNLFAMGMVC